MKKLVIVLMFVLVIAGCGKENNVENESSTNVEQQGIRSEEGNSNENGNNSAEGTKASEVKGYVFEYNGVKIGMDMEAAPIVSALGEPASYFEAPSCAFEGLDKKYGFGSFELDTYEKNGKDYISCIFFCDDLIETPEGVCLFETKADMIAAYGEGFKEESGMLVYEKDGMKLKFILEGDEITSIEYASTVLDVE